VGRRNLTEGNVKTGMFPNSSLREQLLRERLRRWQRKAEQERMLADLPRHGRLRHLVGRASLPWRSGPACSNVGGMIDRVVTRVGAHGPAFMEGI
jgi:hypothetical protein